MRVTFIQSAAFASHTKMDALYNWFTQGKA